MKHWYRKLAAKIVCFILCVTLFITTFVCVSAAVVLGVAGVYSNTEAQLKSESFFALYKSQINNILTDVYSYDKETGYSIGEPTVYLRDDTNLRFQIVDVKGNVLSQNIDYTADVSEDIWTYQSTYYIYGEHYDFIIDSYGVPFDGEEYYIFKAYLEEGLPVSDKYNIANTAIEIGYAIRYAVVPTAIIAFALSAVCFILLMCAVARRPGSDELYPGPVSRFPIDILIAIIAVAVRLYILVLFEISYEEVICFIMAAVGCIVFLNIFLALCVTVAGRVKQRTFFKNMLICIIGSWIVRGIKRIFKALGELILNIPLIWRTLLILCIVTVVEVIIFADAWWVSETLVAIWFAKKVITYPIVLYIAFLLRKLQKGGKALANGDLNYKTDTSLMFWDFKRHGNNLNSIADGMAAAVEKRIQSERMKTELITNVSHDIKTPLTSIINYASLIQDEPCDSQNHKEYAGVLVRKSEHLKRLLEDLVEVSKATSGNLEVALSRCEAGVLLTQIAGEYEERCKAAGLELVVDRPEEELYISVDSRRIWRVFENLMSNACKYSLEGSRVYVAVNKSYNNVVFTFRNTSRIALNISIDELMERFVRGDSSRSTEGNGLGLSIARSLTEIQGGRFDIFVDGDLFKAIVSFPIV